MKVFFPFLLCLIMSFALKAQDTIYARNGNIIRANITNISPKRIEFNYFHSPHKGFKTIRTKNVFSIKYNNGNKEAFIKPPILYRNKTYSDYQFSLREINKDMKRGIASSAVGGVLLITGAAMLGSSFYVMNMEKERPQQRHSGGIYLSIFSTMFLVGGTAPTIIGPIMIVRSKKQLRNVQQINPELSFSPVLNFSTTKAGIGMAMTF
jgi:hypothetical protein